MKTGHFNLPTTIAQLGVRSSECSSEEWLGGKQKLPILRDDARVIPREGAKKFALLP